MFTGIILSSESFKGANGIPLNEVDVIRVITTKNAKAISFDALKMLQTRRKNPLFGGVEAEDGEPVMLDTLLRTLPVRAQKLLLKTDSVQPVLAKAA